MESKNNDAMAETNPFETSFIYLFFFITQDESREWISQFKESPAFLNIMNLPQDYTTYK